MAEAPTAVKLLTIEDLRQLSEDEHPGELVKGEWVEVSRPTWKHGELMAHIAALLWLYLRENPIGRVVCGDPGTILERRPDTLRGPDIAFLRKERIPPEGIPDDWWEGAPDFAIEIVSRSQSAHDLARKALEYLRAGTSLVWVVDPQTRTVAVYTPPDHIRILSEDETLDASDVLPGFQCKVKELLV